MTTVIEALVVFGCVFGGALLGMRLRSLLPETHRSPESKDLIRSTMALIGTMSALVLGLLVASAKGNYDAKRDQLTAAAANIVLLDRVLAHYGPEAQSAREALKGTTSAAIEAIWREGGKSPTRFEDLYYSVSALAPKSDAQRAALSQINSLMLDLGRSRWLLFARSGSAIATPLLVIVVFWLIINFISFGLFASRNPTVLVALFVGALSVAGAVYLILEMDSPFQGVLRLSEEPMRAAIEQLGH
ncbi:MAG TPA: hypothetical protein VKG23_08730 [Thermoanaerobaculia bacterium]|nr:hypothetical protein [Thermoanaerobaculia bacterium]